MEDFNSTAVLENSWLLPWVIDFYLGFLGIGGFVTLVNIFVLLQSRRSGTFTLILVISLIDIATVYVSTVEVVTLYRQTWFLPINHCPLYKGAEVLVNSLSIYSLICFNFHVISLWNLYETEAKRNKRNPLTYFGSDSAKGNSNECLVTRQENRTITIDYRKRKSDVSVVFPAILILVVSLSLSVPNFILSSTLKMKRNETVCAVIDVYYGHIMKNLSMAFEVVIPLTLLLWSLVILLTKLVRTNKPELSSILTKKFTEIRSYLVLAIALTGLYISTSCQRKLLQFRYLSSYSYIDNYRSFKTPPLYNNYMSNTVLIYLTMLHYSCSALRGAVCLGALPSLKYLLKSKFCCKIK